MRAVLDTNVIISALLAPTGAPATILRAWLVGEYELVVSNKLLEELERALAYPKLRRHIDAAAAGEIIELLRRAAETVADPKDPPAVRSSDPGDDYVIALAATARAVIVSGDAHLLGLAAQLPVYSAKAFLEMLAED